MGWIARFLSKAVITGFLAGAAVDVMIGELPKLTGTSSSGDSAWRELWSWIQGLGDIHWTTLVVGARLARRDPRAAVRGARGSRARSCWSSAACSPRACSTSARTASRSSATCRAGCPRPELPDWRPRQDASVDDRHRLGRAAADRVLADGRRRARVRDAAPLPHRRQPGVGRAGDGERRARACSRGCRSRRACRRAR